MVTHRRQSVVSHSNGHLEQQEPGWRGTDHLRRLAQGRLTRLLATESDLPPIPPSLSGCLERLGGRIRQHHLDPSCVVMSARPGRPTRIEAAVSASSHGYVVTLCFEAPGVTACPLRGASLLLRSRTAQILPWGPGRFSLPGRGVLTRCDDVEGFLGQSRTALGGKGWSALGRPS